MKFLGLIIGGGNELLGRTYEFCIKKHSSGTFAFGGWKKYCITETLLLTYYRIIYPHIKYGVIIWGCAPKLYIKSYFSSKNYYVNNRQFENQRFM